MHHPSHNHYTDFLLEKYHSWFRNAHKHKQIWGILPGLGGCPKFVYVFWGHSIWGEKHTSKIPPKVPGQSREKFVYVFFFVCCKAPRYVSQQKDAMLHTNYTRVAHQYFAGNSFSARCLVGQQGSWDIGILELHTLYPKRLRTYLWSKAHENIRKLHNTILGTLISNNLVTKSNAVAPQGTLLVIK